MDARSAQRFWRLTGGNALFLRRLLTDQITAGRMRQVAGVWMWDERVAVLETITDMVGRQLAQLSDGTALVVDTLSQCEPLAVDVLCEVADRADLEAAEQMRLVTVERSGNERMARLAHPLFGELRRAGAGEMRIRPVSGQAGPGTRQEARRRHAVDGAARPAHPRVLAAPARAELFVDAARFAMTLLDLDMGGRHSPPPRCRRAWRGASGVQVMSLVLHGRGDDAEKLLKEITAMGNEDAHRWSTVRAANLIWILGRPADAAAILEGLGAGPESPNRAASRTAVEAQCRRGLRALSVGSRKGFGCIEFGATRGFSRDDGVVRVGDVARCARPRRRARGRRRPGARPSLDVLPDGTPALLVRPAPRPAPARPPARIDDCAKVAKQMADSVNDVPGLADRNLVFLLGQSDLMRGELPDAVKLLHEAHLPASSITASQQACGPPEPPSAPHRGARQTRRVGGSERGAGRGAGERAGHAPLYMHPALAIATGWALAAGGYLVRRGD